MKRSFPPESKQKPHKNIQPKSTQRSRKDLWTGFHSSPSASPLLVQNTPTPCRPFPPSSASTNIIGESSETQAEREPVAGGDSVSVGRGERERGQVQVREGAPQVRLGQVQAQEGASATLVLPRALHGPADAVPRLLRARRRAVRHPAEASRNRTMRDDEAIIITIMVWYWEVN